ncbi:MAG: hypothetical protein U0232_13125 [Thermomicrobiales bacterium]
MDEEIAGREFSERRGGPTAQFRDDRAEETVRHLGQHTRAVAGAGVRADRAAMDEMVERAEGGHEGASPGFAAHVGDESDAAGVVFIRRTIQAILVILRAQCRRKHAHTPASSSAVATVTAPWQLVESPTAPHGGFREMQWIMVRLRCRPSTDAPLRLFGCRVICCLGCRPRDYER